MNSFYYQGETYLYVLCTDGILYVMTEDEEPVRDEHIIDVAFEHYYQEIAA